MNDKKFLDISFLALWPLILIFRVPFEKILSLEFMFWLKLVAFFVFVYTAVQSIRRGKRMQSIVGVVLSVSAFVVINSNLSQRMFLGNKIGKDYVAEAPGFIELMVYDKECTFGYGGIFGVTDIFYCDYEIDNGTFWILTNERILELESSIFKVKGQELEIRRKTVIQHGI